MSRLSAPKFIVGLVNELFIWYERTTVSNPLWYPDKSPEVRAMQGRSGVAKAIVPEVSIPRHLVPIDREISQMDDAMWVALYCRHVTDYDDYRKITGNSMPTWYKYCDAGYWYLTGAVNTEIDRKY